MVLAEERFTVIREAGDQIVLRVAEPDQEVAVTEGADDRVVVQTTVEAETVTREPGEQVIINGVGVPGPEGPQGDPGPQGEDGPAGPAGGEASRYVFEQMIPSASWVIVHNLGRRPNVFVLDSTNREVEGGVQYIDNTTIRLDFAAAFSGTAYLD